MRSLFSPGLKALTLGSLLALPVGTARAHDDPSEPQAAFRLENHLPKDTLCLLSVPDVSAVCQNIRQLRIAKLFEDPGVQQFVQPLMQMVHGQMAELRDRAQGNTEMALAMQALEMLSLIRGQVAFSWVDVRTDTMVASPVILAAIDFRENVGRFQELLAPMLDHVDRVGLERRMETVGGKDVESIFFGPVRVWHTFLGGVWLLATDATALEHVLTGANDGHSLLTSEKFQRVRSRVAPHGEQMLMYCDLELAWTRFGDWIPARYRGIIDALGLRGIEALAYGCEFADGAVNDSIFVELAEERHGIPALWKPQQVHHDMLGYVPGNALYYGASAIDLQHLYTQGRAIAASFGPDVDEKVQRVVDQIEGLLGISLELDFLAPMGQEIGMYVAPPTGGGLIPDVVCYAHLQDSARFEQTFRKIVDVASSMLAEEGVSLTLKDHEHQGTPYMTLDVSFEHSRDPFPLRPCIVFGEKGMAMTLVPHAMKNAIENFAQGGAKPSLAEKADFQAMLAQAPKGHAAFGYLDTKSVCVWAYNTLMPIAQAVLHGNFLQRNLGLPFPVDFADMPTGKVFAQYMSSCGEWATSDANGLSVTWRTPTGIAPLVVALGAGAFVFLAADHGPATMEIRSYEEPQWDHGSSEPDHAAPSEPRVIIRRGR